MIINHKKIIGCAHHKAGTNLLYDVLSSIEGKQFTTLAGDIETRNRVTKNEQYVYCSCSEFNMHYDQSDDFKGVHILRHPFELATSAYNFYKGPCTEPWSLKPQERFDGLNWKQHLNNTSQDEGIHLVIDRLKLVFVEMCRFPYDDKRFINVRMEDFFTTFDEEIARIATFLDRDVKLAVDRCKKHDKQRAEFICRYPGHVVNNKKKYRFPDFLNAKHINHITKILNEADAQDHWNPRWKDNKITDIMTTFNYTRFGN